MSQPDSILARELRNARLAAPPHLRARVLELAAREPEPRPRRRPALRLRRVALAVGAAAAVAAIAAAVGGGLFGAASSPSRRAEPAGALREAAGAAVGQAPLQSSARGSAPLAPARTRAQDYEATLRLRVPNLSRATKRVLQLTRGYGGYVRSVDYGSGASAGSADLVLRVPVGSVQAAIVRFSELGTILEQHVSIRDVQPALDVRFRRLQALRVQIAGLQRRLAGANLDDAQRKLLEAQVARARAQLVALERVQAQAEKRAGFATVSLALTARKALVAPPHRGRVGRALDHAVSILMRELVILVYVAVVAVPLLALVLLLAGGERMRRRRANERLLASR
jgi:hypothetical protein